MIRWMLLASSLALMPGSIAAEREPVRRVAGVVFDARVSDESFALRLNGTGLLRYLGFKGYAAALYLGEGVPPERALDDVPRRLEIEYFRAIPAERFAWATAEGIEKNVGAGRAQQLAPQIERFNDLYAGVEPGDRYALTYLPDRGTELALNGLSLGVVEGTEFARALFSIWLGSQPLDAGLKTNLLGMES